MAHDRTFLAVAEGTIENARVNSLDTYERAPWSDCEEKDELVAVAGKEFGTWDALGIMYMGTGRTTTWIPKIWARANFFIFLISDTIAKLISWLVAVCHGLKPPEEFSTFSISKWRKEGFPWDSSASWVVRLNHSGSGLYICKMI